MIMDNDDKFNEDFKDFLSMLAAANKKRENEKRESWMGHQAVAKLFMEMFMAFQQVGFTRDEAFELLKIMVGTIGTKI